MSTSRIQIIGGGPAGLYVGNLLKQRHPSWDVHLAERLPPSETYGFGVGLTTRTLQNLQLADPGSKEDVVDAGYRPGLVTMETFADDLTWDWGAHNGALTIARSTLLEVLQRAAERAGVKVETGRELTLDECDADLVIAADGSGSSSRHALAERVGATAETGRMLFIWVGLDRALSGNIFIPVRTDHGVFVAHAYPYADDRSTLVVETDEATWRAAGLDVPKEYVSPADSDDDTLAYLQAAFEPHLLGGRLIGNRSRWARYQTVRCDRWFVDRTVLLGDAARTAHYSLGSGTKLALEDAIELADVLDDLEDVPSSLSEYEHRRRPTADRLQRLANRSHLWWEGFPARAHRPAASVAIAYLSRGGNVPLEKVAQSQPEVTARALEQYAGDDGSFDGGWDDLRRWVLSQSYEGKRLQASTRVLDGEALGVPAGLGPESFLVVGSTEPVLDGANGRAVLVRLDVPPHDWMGDCGNDFVAQCIDLLDLGCDGVVLTGSAQREALLDRLSLGERIKLQTSAVVVVEGTNDVVDDLVDGLIAARTDLVRIVDR